MKWTLDTTWQLFAPMAALFCALLSQHFCCCGSLHPSIFCLLPHIPNQVHGGCWSQSQCPQARSRIKLDRERETKTEKDTQVHTHTEKFRVGLWKVTRASKENSHSHGETIRTPLWEALARIKRFQKRGKASIAGCCLDEFHYCIQIITFFLTCQRSFYLSLKHSFYHGLHSCYWANNTCHIGGAITRDVLHLIL